MPKQHLTDTWIKNAPFCDKATWFTDPRYPGLRLQITRSTKTFHASKWDAAEGKARTKKLGAFTPKQNLKWAARQVTAFAQEVEEGSAVTTREEKREAELEAARNRPPTLIECVDQFLEFRSVDRKRKAMKEATRRKYRQAVENHLAPWVDTHIDELPALAIREHLNGMQIKQPQGAMYVHNALGTALRWFNKQHMASITVPGLTEATPTGTADVDHDIAIYPQRWAEIEALGDPVEAALWKVRWLTGLRITVLLPMTWDQFNAEFGTLSIGQDKQHPPRTIALADAVVEIISTLPRRSDFIFARPSGAKRWQMRSIGLNVSQDMRHLWSDASTACYVHDIVHGHLCGQTEGKKKVRGHYTDPPLETQRDAANKIAGWILARAQPQDGKVIDLKGATA